MSFRNGHLVHNLEKAKPSHTKKAKEARAKAAFDLSQFLRSVQSTTINWWRWPWQFWRLFLRFLGRRLRVALSAHALRVQSGYGFQKLDSGFGSKTRFRIWFVRFSFWSPGTQNARPAAVLLVTAPAACAQSSHGSGDGAERQIIWICASSIDLSYLKNPIAESWVFEIQSLCFFYGFRIWERWFGRLPVFNDLKLWKACF